MLRKGIKTQMGIACKRSNGTCVEYPWQLAEWRVLLKLPLFGMSYNDSCDKLSSGSSFRSHMVSWLLMSV